MNMKQAAKQLKEIAQGNAHTIGYSLRTDTDGVTHHRCEVTIRLISNDEFHYASKDTFGQALEAIKDSLNAEDGVEDLEKITDDQVQS